MLPRSPDVLVGFVPGAAAPPREVKLSLDFLLPLWSGRRNKDHQEVNISMSVETRLTQPDSQQHTVVQSRSQETMSQRADDQVPTDMKKKVLLLADVFSVQIFDEKIDISGTWMHPPEGQRFASSSSAHVRTSNCNLPEKLLLSGFKLQFNTHTHTHCPFPVRNPSCLGDSADGFPISAHTISRVTSWEKRGSFIAI